MIHAEIVREPIDPERIVSLVGSHEDGATVLFVGTVRNHADGRGVRAVRYEAYEEMAADVLEAIAEETARAMGRGSVAVAHRVGELVVGEPSVAIAVSSPHRAEAYEASRYVIEEIKQRLPVWKQELYVDGDARWVEGVNPDGTAGGSSPMSPSPTPPTGASS